MTFEKKEIPLEQPKIRRYNYHCVSNLINVKHRIRAVSPFQPDNKKHSHFKSPLLQFHIHFICLFSLVSTIFSTKTCRSGKLETENRVWIFALWQTSWQVYGESCFLPSACWDKFCHNSGISYCDRIPSKTSISESNWHNSDGTKL